MNSYFRYILTFLNVFVILFVIFIVLFCFLYFLYFIYFFKLVFINVYSGFVILVKLKENYHLAEIQCFL